MKIVSKQVLKTYDGKNLQTEDKANVLLRSVLVNALGYEDQSLQPTEEQKIRAYELSIKLMNEEIVELKSDDVVYIKTRLLKMYGPLIFGQVVQILEGRDEQSNAKETETKPTL